MTFVLIFTLGYFCGGLAALLIFGLALAARRGDHGDTGYQPATKKHI